MKKILGFDRSCQNISKYDKNVYFGHEFFMASLRKCTTSTWSSCWELAGVQVTPCRGGMARWYSCLAYRSRPLGWSGSLGVRYGLRMSVETPATTEGAVRRRAASQGHKEPLLTRLYAPGRSPLWRGPPCEAAGSAEPRASLMLLLEPVGL